MNHVLHQYHLVLFLLIEYSLHVVGLVLRSERPFYSLLYLAFTHHVIVMIKSACLMPSLLILLNLLLPYLHLCLKLFFHAHLPHLVFFLVFLPFPSHFLLQVLYLVLDELSWLVLACTIPLQCLAFFVIIIKFLVSNAVLVSLTLVLEGHPLLF